MATGLVIALSLALLQLASWGAPGLGADASTIPRLSRAVWPVLYNLTLATDFTGTNFDGNVSIEVEVREATDNITLHARGIFCSGIRVIRIDQEDDSPPLDVEWLRDTEQVTLRLPSALPVGSRYHVHIDFLGKLNTAKQQGYYRLRLSSDGTNWMSGTVFEYDHAREVFPCFDEPEFKAKFRVSLIHSGDHTALSNMPIASSQVFNSGGLVIDHFEETPIMPPHLVAFHLTRFANRQVLSEDGRPMRVWVPNSQLSKTNFSLVMAPRAEAWLRNYTALPDPMPKIDLVSVPWFHGALENWGVISFTPSALVPRVEGPMFQVDSHSFIAHELAHTWFGNMVTPRWWDSLWLSEGAATFFASLALNQLLPRRDQFLRDSQTHWTLTAHANKQPTAKPLNSMNDLKSINADPYFKGFCMFRMLYYILGPDKFQAGIRKYLKNYQFSSTTPESLYDEMDFSYENHKLSELMTEWTYHAGLPIVTAIRTGGNLILTQARFVVNKEKNITIQDDTKWWVPVSVMTGEAEGKQKKYVSEADSQPRLWFREPTSIKDPAPPENWLLLNVNAAGTYHVRYDAENLMKLQKALLNRQLPVMNRYQLTLDYGLFTAAGLNPLPEVLQLLRFLEEERHFAPWTAAVKVFGEINSRLSGTPAGEKFQEHVRKLVGKEFARLGLRTHKSDTVPITEQRKIITSAACLFRLADCDRQASKLFRRWMDQTVPDKVNPIPTDLRVTVSCSALRSGGEEEWTFLRDRAQRAKSLTTREQLFIALGCAPNTDLLKTLMDSDGSSNSKIKQRDLNNVLKGMIQHNDDPGAVLSFLEHMTDKLRIGVDSKVKLDSTMVEDLSHKIVAQEHFQQLSDLISKRKTRPSRKLAEIQRIVEHNISWRELNKNIL